MKFSEARARGSRLLLLLAILGIGVVLVSVLVRLRREEPRLSPASHEPTSRGPTVAKPAWPDSLKPNREGDSTFLTPKPVDIESRFTEIIDRLAAAVKAKNVWKEEIKLLVALEDLLLSPEHARRLMELIVAKINESSTGRDLAGLLTFVLSVSPTDGSRKDMAGLLGKNKGNDASLVYAITLRQSRVGLDAQGREAFWKGCMSFMERGDLLSLGFRSRLFKEEYGRSLEQVALTEVVHPSRADAFDGKIMSAFHALQKKGFTTYIEEKDSTREALVCYLVKGELPEAKSAICRQLKPGEDLSHAAREAFMGSQSYSDDDRRWLLNLAQAGSSGGTWDTLYSLYPFAGNMKYEMLERMASTAGAVGPRQDQTLKLFQTELSQGPVPDALLHRLMRGLSDLRSEASEKYHFEVCRNHANESVRATAVSALYSDGLEGAADPALIQKRVSCAEDRLLRDASTEVKVTAVKILSLFLSDQGQAFRISNVDQVRAHVQTLLRQELIDGDVANAILKGLDKHR